MHGLYEAVLMDVRHPKEEHPPLHHAHKPEAFLGLLALLSASYHFASSRREQ